MNISITDDRNRVLLFAHAPKRVVSLVPSDTLNVAELGGGSALVGRTDYCELPEEIARTVPSVGGTKNPRIPDILDLSPDLVIMNQEENSRGDMEALVQKGVRVLVCFPRTVAAGIAHFARLGRVFHVAADPRVRELVKRGYEAVRQAGLNTGPPLRVFCPIWMDPLMTIHGDTFISDMLTLAGGVNVFRGRERRYPLAADLGRVEPLPADKVAERDKRYPRVTIAELVSENPELILLPDEPHPFTEGDAAIFRALDVDAAKDGNVVFCNGKDLCWYGVRSIEGLPRVQALLRASARA